MPAEEWGGEVGDFTRPSPITNGSPLRLGGITLMWESKFRTRLRVIYIILIHFIPIMNHLLHLLSGMFLQAEVLPQQISTEQSAVMRGQLAA
jgi:hypothetical protein